jgi:hypothetical protein
MWLRCHRRKADGRAVSARHPRARAPRSRQADSGLPWLREELSRWDEGDEHIESLQAAAAVEGLVLRPLWSERPICVHRHEFRSWTADLSVFEVLLQEDA